MNKLWKAFLNEESGQGMVEYGLIVAIVSVALIVILGTMRDELRNVFTRVQQELDNATP